MDEEIGQKVFQQAMDLWINPEIEKRKKFGKLPKKFKLLRAQIIFYSKKATKIRLNEEVGAIVSVKLNKDVKKGEAIYEQDVSQIKNIKLTDYHSNCAHITFLLFREKWMVAFDFRYNKKLVKENLEAAKEFYESAKDDLEKNRLRPFYENCWSSAELTSVCTFYLLGESRKKNRHKETTKKFEKWAELGNIKESFSKTLSKLNHLRNSARYLYTNEFKKENHGEILKIIKEMIDFTEKSIK